MKSCLGNHEVDASWHSVFSFSVLTVAAIFAGLLPLLWADSADPDTMRRLGVPMIGRVTTSFILELQNTVLFFLTRRVTLRSASHQFAIEQSGTALAV